jgi:hypothetical protein
MKLHEWLADRDHRCRDFTGLTEDGEFTHNYAIATRTCLIGACRKVGVSTDEVRRELGVRQLTALWDKATDEEQDAIVSRLKAKDL